MSVDPAIVARLRDAAAGFPNPGVNDTVIVRRGDLRALLEVPTDQPTEALTDRDRIAFLRTLLQAYRRKRAVDGLNNRLWDGAVHWKAEQEIVQLEAQWAALERDEHWTGDDT